MIERLDANVPHFRIEVEGSPSELRVLQFQGEEAISKLFHFSVQAESDQFDIDPKEIVGSKVLLYINSNGYARKIHGLASGFEFTDMERNVAIYNIDLSPDHFVLSRNRNFRIFQDTDPLKIIEAVLKEAELPSGSYQIACNEQYEPLEYCVQYRESDLDFITRLTARFGMFFFFVFDDSRSRMVFGDDPGVHPEIPDSKTMKFHPQGSTREYEDYIYKFSRSHSIRPTKHSLRDYSFESPRLNLTQNQNSSYKYQVEWYDYPGMYKSQSQGSKAAKILSEAEECRRLVSAGMSNSVRLVPGHAFDLEFHPVHSMNKEYMVVRSMHAGSQPAPESAIKSDQGYSAEFWFLEAGVPYRSAPVTRGPVVKGSQTAVVTGPEGHEIFCDEYGRIKVRFHWDRSDTPDDQSSCWIRVAQRWAGKGYGGMVIPRIGQEVIVDFLEGNPDRPIVTGCVYNGLNMPPYALPDKQTVSTIKSDSSLGSDGFNEIRFEDSKGSEEVYHHAQKDLTIVTENDKNQTTGANETLSIGKNRTKSVDGDEQSTIDGNRTESVGENESVTVDGNRFVSINKDESLSVERNRSVSVTKDDTFDVVENSSVRVGKDQKESIGKNRTVDIGQDLRISIKKKCGTVSGDSMLLSSDKDITLECGSAQLVMKKNGDIQIKGSKIQIKGSGNVNIKGSKVTNN